MGHLFLENVWYFPRKTFQSVAMMTKVNDVLQLSEKLIFGRWGEGGRTVHQGIHTVIERVIRSPFIKNIGNNTYE